MDISILIFGALAVIVVICEYFNGKQRAETEDKIDEIHRWLKRCHPYKFNGYDDRDKIEYRDSKRMQDNLPNDIDIDMTNRQDELARKIIKTIKENKG